MHSDDNPYIPPEKIQPSQLDPLCTAILLPGNCCDCGAAFSAHKVVSQVLDETVLQCPEPEITIEKTIEITVRLEESDARIFKLLMANSAALRDKEDDESA